MDPGIKALGVTMLDIEQWAHDYVKHGDSSILDTDRRCDWIVA